MKFILVLNFFSVLVFAQTSPVANVKSYSDFLSKEWTKLEYPVSKPLPGFLPDQETLGWLNLEKGDGVSRNTQINKEYFKLSEQLQKCTATDGWDGSPRVANWFTFAVWASKSAGEVINGHKFRYPDYEVMTKQLANSSTAGNIRMVEIPEIMDELSAPVVLASKLTAAEHVCSVNTNFVMMFGLKTEAMQRQLFAETNYQIAAEMIPLGQDFIRTFCEPGLSSEELEKRWGSFSVKFGGQDQLRKAMRSYLDAKLNTDQVKKAQYILAGSTLQVFSEQERVDKNLDKAFSAVPVMSNENLTASAGFFFGSDDKGNLTNFLPLNRDVPSDKSNPYFKTIVNPALKKLHAQCTGSACSDWADLDQRKDYLKDAFMRLASPSPGSPNYEIFDEPN